MRNKQRLLKEIRVADRGSVKNDIGETVEGWLEPVALKATVLPLSDHRSVEMYGERANSMMRVITKTPLKKGQGVWLPGETGEEPVWTVTSTEDWTQHQSVTIEVR